MEGLLSIDNAAVLATMVSHLPPSQRAKALRYWMVGAYVFRWIALMLAAYLIQFAWLKFVWGAYLVYLAYSHFFKKEDESGVKVVSRGFWSTVAMVEVMDMVFSIDNVFAAVAMSPKLWVVVTWVFIGILAMRFVAGVFVTLMEKYPSLATSAYLVILILGLKLTLSVAFHWIGLTHIAEAFESHTASAVTSGMSILLFAFPILKSKFVK